MSTLGTVFSDWINKMEEAMFLFAKHSNTTVLPENNGTTIIQGNVRASPGLIYLSYITLPVFLVVGLYGNTLTLIVTRSKKYKTSFHGVLIAAMAITDITYLLLAPFSKQFVNRPVWTGCTCLGDRRLQHLFPLLPSLQDHFCRARCYHLPRKVRTVLVPHES